MLNNVFPSLSRRQDLHVAQVRGARQASALPHGREQSHHGKRHFLPPRRELVAPGGSGELEEEV